MRGSLALASQLRAAARNPRRSPQESQHLHLKRPLAGQAGPESRAQRRSVTLLFLCSAPRVKYQHKWNRAHGSRKETPPAALQCQLSSNNCSDTSRKAPSSRSPETASPSEGLFL